MSKREALEEKRQRAEEEDKRLIVDNAERLLANGKHKEARGILDTLPPEEFEKFACRVQYLYGVIYYDKVSSLRNVEYGIKKLEQAAELKHISRPSLREERENPD